MPCRACPLPNPPPQAGGGTLSTCCTPSSLHLPDPVGIRSACWACSAGELRFRSRYPRPLALAPRHRLAARQTQALLQRLELGEIRIRQRGGGDARRLRADIDGRDRASRRVDDRHRDRDEAELELLVDDGEALRANLVED